ncbi:MAG: [protein-PII] uridylyltransferase [Cryomorphaceae bacterium]|jgi:[protein-PII] uridylyltransferase
MHFTKSKLLNPSIFKHQLGDALELPIKPFKQAIKNALEQLKAHQNTGTSAADLVGKYTWMIDQLVVIAWNHHQQHLYPDLDIELVAVGGYGRRELHPYSDVDLLILLPGDDYDAAQEMIESFLRFLWDIGLEIGHSVRSIKDCLKEARADLTIMTNLLEARHLAGDESLFVTLDSKLRGGRIWSPDKFFNGKYEEQLKRHAQYQDTAYSLEPNLKDSPGGLRDLQTILWVYNRHYGVRSFREMKEQELINNDEYRILIRARNILWKMRSGLHLITNRHEDRLLFDTQRQLAQEFGYKDNDARMAVEQLMKRYYRTVQYVVYLNEVLLSHYRVSNGSRFSLAVGRNIDDDFAVKSKLIEQRSADLFAKKPTAMLKMFTLMQEHKIAGIHPDTIRSIRSNLDQVNNRFRADPEAQRLFLEMFKDDGIGLTNALARMNAYGLLGAYLPNFGAIVGQMQHDLFHVYTVDGHTLMVISNLTRLRKYPDEYPVAAGILDDLYRPERLFLGALFHDIAKGRGGDHSELGEADAHDFCIQHGLSEYDAKLVGWLVLNHLRMSHFSQRRDISDPDVIQEFADLVGDEEHLDNLYLLTLADIRGTSPKVWNAWKGQLLLDLYHGTRQALRRGSGTPINEQEHIEDHKKAALELVIEQIGEKAIDKEHIHQFWSKLPNDYFTRNEPYYIAWHATSLSQATAISMPLVSIRYSERLEANMFFVLAPETNKLLTQVTGAFDEMELDIIEARLQLSSYGYALYTFSALVADSESAKDEVYLSFLEDRVRLLILDKDSNKSISRRSASRALKHFPIQPKVSFLFNNPSYTTMEVVAQNQPGFLHNVARILAQHNIILISARIGTFGERAEDIFYIRKHDHSPVVEPELLADLEQKICSALDKSPSKKKSKPKSKSKPINQH